MAKTEAIVFTVEEIEAMFYLLCDGYHHDEIDLDLVKSALETLGFFDKNGVIWTIGVNSGEWYRWDGKEWIKDTPEGYLYQTYETQEPNSEKTIDYSNPIMKKLLKKA